MSEAPLSPRLPIGQNRKGQQVKLPQEPRKREEFSGGAGKRQLANAGSRIAEGGNRSKATSVPPSARKAVAAGGAGPASARGPRPGAVGVRDRSESPDTSVTSEGPPRSPGGDVTAAVVLGPSGAMTPRSQTKQQRDAANAANASAKEKLFKGGEDMVRRLADMGNASEQMRSQLEAQAKEVLSLKESTAMQQLLIKSYDQQLELVKQQEAASVEARMRKEMNEVEARLRAEFEAERERHRKEREELVDRVTEKEGESMQREGERDEARLRIQELELRINEMAERQVLGGGQGAGGSSRAAAPQRRSVWPSPGSITGSAPAGSPTQRPTILQDGPMQAASRAAPKKSMASVVVAAAGSAEAALTGSEKTVMKSLEMELSLVRSRLAKEAQSREAVERESASAAAERSRLQAEIERKVAEERRLRRAVAEQAEKAAYRQELCNDLQQQLNEERAKAAHALRAERGKVVAVSRLEGILPRHILMKALN